MSALAELAPTFIIPELWQMHQRGQAAEKLALRQFGKNQTQKKQNKTVAQTRLKTGRVSSVHVPGICDYLVHAA